MVFFSKLLLLFSLALVSISVDYTTHGIKGTGIIVRFAASMIFFAAFELYEKYLIQRLTKSQNEQPIN